MIEGKENYDWTTSWRSSSKFKFKIEP